jgi:hypothetical protein
MSVDLLHDKHSFPTVVIVSGSSFIWFALFHPVGCVRSLYSLYPPVGVSTPLSVNQSQLIVALPRTPQIQQLLPVDPVTTALVTAHPMINSL